MHQHFHATHGQGTGSPVTFSITEILSKVNSKDFDLLCNCIRKMTFNNSD